MMGAMLPNCGVVLALLVGSCAFPGVAAGMGQSDSPPPHRTSFVALPYVYYTPETKIAFGGGSIYSFRPADGSPSNRPSGVRVAST